MKKVTDNQLNGELGETVVKGAVLGLGHVFEGRGRLETGIDGTIEFRDLSTGRMTGKMVAVQVKTTAAGRYTRESDAGFEYLLEATDLAYWQGTNLPVVIVLFRPSDQSLFWKDVTQGRAGDERRLLFDKACDRLNAASMDRMASLSVERGRLGSFVPPMRMGETAHLNLMRLAMPEEIFLAESPFKSGRDAIHAVLKHEGKRLDWVIRGRRFVSFQDPRGTSLQDIVEEDTVEAVDTAHVADSDDPDDGVVMIELLRRTLEEQCSEDLAYDKQSRAFHFRAPNPLAVRDFHYKSLAEMTSAKVVKLYPDSKDKQRLNSVRHHAFVPRFERLGQEWYVSINPTFFYSEDGFRQHRYASALLTRKKRLDRNASIRGQVFLWKHFLETRDGSLDAMPALFDFGSAPKGPLRFVDVAPVVMDTAVPEDAWAWSDPNFERMKARAEFEPSFLKAQEAR